MYVFDIHINFGISYVYIYICAYGDNLDTSFLNIIYIIKYSPESFILKIKVSPLDPDHEIGPGFKWFCDSQTKTPDAQGPGEISMG